MSGLRMLDLVKPFQAILPEIVVPARKLPFYDKIAYTVGIAITFFVMAGIPLYGAHVSESDPYSFTRAISASSHGTLMELGVGPMVTSGIIFQILGGFQALNVNFDVRADRELFQSGQKIFALLLTFFHAVFLVFFAQTYGTISTDSSVSELSLGAAVLIVAQLTAAGLVLILLGEIVDKGYSFGSGSGLFTALSVSQNFMWQNLALLKVHHEFVGSIPALLVGLWKNGLFNFGGSYRYIIENSFFRQNLPNLLQLYLSVAVFLLTIYLNTFRVDIPIKSSRVRSLATAFPVKLLYTGSMCLFLLSAFSQNVLIYSQSLYVQFPDNLMVQVLGSWGADGSPVGGIAYYISPSNFGYDVIKMVLYSVYTIVGCTLFSKYWAEISGSAPKDVAKQFQAQSIVIVGQRAQSAPRELAKVIPVAAAVGGAVVGAIVAVCDIFGGLGASAAPMIVAVTSMNNYFEILAQEGDMAQMGKAFGM
ncbi:Protein transport protein SEC61 subunit alpha [Yarrowia sp. B02]|nr:Protein transport protein SEC61 subunit alpha [Yarrowia sp. B02]